MQLIVMFVWALTCLSATWVGFTVIERVYRNEEHVLELAKLQDRALSVIEKIK